MGHREAALELVCRADDVGRGDRQRIRGQLLRCAGRLGQDQDGLALADEHRLLGHEVHAVDDRVDEHDVGQPQRRDRHRVVGPVVDPDRLLVGIGSPLIRATTSRTAVAYSAYSGTSVRVGAWTARKRTRFRELGPPPEQVLEGEEAAQHVLRRLDPVGADDQRAA